MLMKSLHKREKIYWCILWTQTKRMHLIITWQNKKEKQYTRKFLQGIS